MIYVYMYIIHWKRKTSSADFMHVGIFLAWLEEVRVLEFFHTFDGVVT